MWWKETERVDKFQRYTLARWLSYRQQAHVIVLAQACPQAQFTLETRPADINQNLINQVEQKIDKGCVHTFLLCPNNRGWGPQPADRTLTPGPTLTGKDEMLTPEESWRTLGFLPHSPPHPLPPNTSLPPPWRTTTNLTDWKGASRPGRKGRLRVVMVVVPDRGILSFRGISLLLRLSAGDAKVLKYEMLPSQAHLQWKQREKQHTTWHVTKTFYYKP